MEEGWKCLVLDEVAMGSLFSRCSALESGLKPEHEAKSRPPGWTTKRCSAMGRFSAVRAP